MEQPRVIRGLRVVAGVIRNSNGIGMAVITFPIGNQTNHFAEAYAALQTTMLAKEMGISRLWLEGDSNNIIKCLKGEHPPSWNIINIFEETKQILNSFEKVYISNEYRESNSISDWMANDAVKSDKPKKWINGASLPMEVKCLIDMESI